RELDEVAYLRFASVYRSFDSLADFEREITALRADARRPESRNNLQGGGATASGVVTAGPGGSADEREPDHVANGSRPGST
ncbi:MAG TPA: hypothetical protein VF163_05695, partial [Micromonosporaceae bacterium]